MSDHSGSFLNAASRRTTRWRLSISSAAFFLLSLPVCLPSLSAAGEWRLDGAVTNTASVNDNPANQSQKTGAAFFGVSAFDVRLLGATRVSEFTADGGVRLRRNTGPAANEVRNVEEGYGALSYARTVGALSFHAALKYQNVATAYSEVEDSGLLNTDARRKNSDLRSGLKWQINENNRLSASVSRSTIDFSGPSAELFVGSTLFGTSLTWEHHVNTRTRLISGYQFRQFEADDDVASHTNRHALLVGVRYQYNPRVFVKASGALSYNIINQDDLFSGGAQGMASLRKKNKDRSVTSLQDLSITYLRKAFEGEFLVSQDISPSSIGELQVIRRAVVSGTYRANQRTTLSTRAELNNRRALSSDDRKVTERTVYAFDIKLRRDLTPNWTGELSYRLRFEDKDGINTSSNIGKIAFKRSFTLNR